MRAYAAIGSSTTKGQKPGHIWSVYIEKDGRVKNIESGLTETMAAYQAERINWVETGEWGDLVSLPTK